MSHSSNGVSNSCSSEDFYRRVRNARNASAPGTYALVSMDYDNFNFVNDMFGYETGNAILERIESRFSDGMHPGEFLTRVHADHFIFWVRAIDPELLRARFCLLADMRACLSDLLPSHYNFVCSGGIVYASDPIESTATLLDKANFARKRAKGNHLNTFFVYDAKLEEELNWKKIITSTMESALQDHEFQMYLQPKIRMKDKRMIGSEALVRWSSPRYGMIYPDRFIPVLEQNGFIAELDFFMLEQACLFMRDLQKMDLPVLPISVNFSKVHLQNPHLVEEIYGVVNRTGIPSHLIEIEMTESVISEDLQTLVDISRHLKSLGFAVSLDDFGSAYSSLSCLKELPIDVIKIDKGFLDASAYTDRGRLILTKMVELIKSLSMVPVMEGVETLEQVEFLDALSCDIVQGFYYAKPMCKEDFIAYLRSIPAEQNDAALGASCYII